MSAARLTVLDAAVLERLRTGQLRDAIDDAAPDALVATSVGARNRLRASPAVPAELPVLLVADAGSSGEATATSSGEATATSNGTADATSSGTADAAANSIEPTRASSSVDDPADPAIQEFGDVAVAVGTDDATLAAIGERLDGDEIDAAHAYALTDRLSLSIRPTELATSVDGLADYRAALARGTSLSGEEATFDDVTHVSTKLPADYAARHRGLALRGASPTDEERDAALGGGAGEPAIVTLALGPDGAVGTREVGPDALGLRAVRGVGRKRADALRSAGIATRTDLANADIARLADTDGLGRGTAQRLREHARAHREGRAVRRGDATLPDREPVFVDVETDGLSPSIVWLVGALDRERGDGDDERYVSFLARDPDEPGEALAAFCSWYVANASDRPIVAYNGWSFDFPVIEEQVERHCPQYLADWRDAWRFDPYEWAVREGNAVLPGRTNQLADVAAALGDGSEGDDESAPNAATPKPLTGAEVGRLYRRWIRERTPAAAPDWERLEAYCEDDVRALAAVYDALWDADRIEARADADGRTATTTQGNLGDFS